MTYTNNNIEDVKRMSYPQYKAIIASISEKINWDIHLSTLSVTGEFQNELNPLYSESSPENRVFKMSDAMALNNFASKG